METNIVQAAGRGYAKIPGVGVMTYSISGFSDMSRESEYAAMYRQYLYDNSTLALGDYIVASWGENHNLYPNEVYNVISENKILPEILSKQVEFLFGKGPYLYRYEVVGDGKNSRRIRVPVINQQIEDWLASWEDRGYQSHWDYLLNLIKDYYHVLTCVSKYRFNKARRLMLLGVQSSALPIAALEYVGSDMARLATTRPDARTRKLSDTDMTHVLVGDWLHLSGAKFDIYPRFNPSQPFAASDSISWSKSRTFSRDIYPQNEWYKGLVDWIKASNLTPRYINSFLENAINAFMHVEIPIIWLNRQKEKLEQIINENISGLGDIISSYEGVQLIDGNNQPLMFSEKMLDDRLQHELVKITEMLSGSGKNQGRLWASVTYGDQGWKFSDLPGKYGEYMKNVIDYDKRADQVILAGKGINASISNVENDGVISKSGSDVYYNYMIYQNSLVIDEYIVCRDLNRAIRLNFPHAKQQGIYLGFQMDIPAKQQETTPSDRLQNTVGQ